MRYLTPVRIDETKKRNKVRHARAMIKQGIDDEFKAKTTAQKIAAKKKVIGGEAKASRGELGAMAATNIAVSRSKKKPAWKRNVARKTAEFAIQQGKEAKATQKRVDETKRENKARHAFAMIRQGIRDGAKATTPAEKLAALRTKKAGQARSSRAYWGAFAAKEKAASKNETDPAKRQLASNLGDWGVEKGQQARGRQKRVSDSIVPLTMDSLMEVSKEKYDSMTANQRLNYGGKVASRYRRMFGGRKGSNPDLGTPLRALKAVKDRAYTRAGATAELENLKKRRKLPITKRERKGGRAGSTESNIDSAGDDK